jgi:hypothetical protein
MTTPRPSASPVRKGRLFRRDGDRFVEIYVPRVRRWRRAGSRELSDVHGDAVLYRDLTLSLVWPRSCPEWIDDDTVSFHLRKCARENTLPWAIDDSCLFWSE